CHKRYRHVLVDEYQDINELQDAILRLVSTECLRGKDEGRRMKDENGADASAASPFSSFILPPSSFPPGNLFCVGDVKQSIYRFRLADPSRFIARSKAFDREPAGGGGRIIDLQKNFRSRGPLLEAINTTFERLMTEAAADITYDASQRLNAGATFPLDDGGPRFDGAPIELHVLPADVVGDDADDGADLERAEREGLFIADRIKQMLGLVGSAPARVATADGYRDARPRDVAILLRTRKFKIGQYATALRQAGVAVHADGGSGFFASQEVSDVLALLRLLDNRRQDVPMAAVLRSPIAALAEPEDALARVRLAYPTTPDQPVPFCDAAVRYAREQDDELAARLRDFFKQLDEWRELARRRPLAELLSHVYEQSGYLAFCCGLPDGPQRRANLLELHRRAAQFGSFHRQGLSRFMQFLNSLEEESDLGQASVASEAADAVRVLTIHESKGLEFPIVFLADLGKAINLSDCGGPILLDRAAGLGLQVADEHRQVRYPSLAYLLVQQR
ncbi:MAG TPA: 3'-5' exonuclease, partial [Tepidisphaeraceae bacterium]|nr:3'-5' exonuclease [Tepidisphaeraceae bacterium]